MSDKLRECPFCGSYEKLFKYHSENCFLLLLTDALTCDAEVSQEESLNSWNTRHQPPHETVEQWEKRTGETYPDDGPIYVRYRVYEGSDQNTVNEDDWTEWMWTVMFWHDYEKFSSVLDSEYIDWEIGDAYVANHHGKPPVYQERDR